MTHDAKILDGLLLTARDQNAALSHRIESLTEGLQDLHDEQNDALEEHRRKTWQAAMDKAALLLALAPTEEKLCPTCGVPMEPGIIHLYKRCRSE